MKKMTKLIAIVFASSILLTSCYSYTNVVGEGAKGNVQVTKWNHYLIEGLIPVNVSDAKDMAGGAKNYTVHTRHTFLNGLLMSITFGIYSPTTTTVTR